MSAELEAEARRLRNLIYGPQSENEWQHCKAKWVEDIEWLRAEAKKIIS